jgi:hypothetical protein
MASGVERPSGDERTPLGGSDIRDIEERYPRYSAKTWEEMLRIGGIMVVAIQMYWTGFIVNFYLWWQNSGNDASCTSMSFWFGLSSFMCLLVALGTAVPLLLLSNSINGERGLRFRRLIILLPTLAALTIYTVVLVFLGLVFLGAARETCSNSDKFFAVYIVQSAAHVLTLPVFAWIASEIGKR